MWPNLSPIPRIMFSENQYFVFLTQGIFKWLITTITKVSTISVNGYRIQLDAQTDIDYKHYLVADVLVEILKVNVLLIQHAFYILKPCYKVNELKRNKYINLL